MNMMFTSALFRFFQCCFMLPVTSLLTDRIYLKISDMTNVGEAGLLLCWSAAEDADGMGGGALRRRGLCLFESRLAGTKGPVVVVDRYHRPPLQMSPKIGRLRINRN
ncbi:hypothetical protein PAMP_001702 [Pampus punctatissimus]